MIHKKQWPPYFRVLVYIAVGLLFLLMVTGLILRILEETENDKTPNPKSMVFIQNMRTGEWAVSPAAKEYELSAAIARYNTLEYDELAKYKRVEPVTEPPLYRVFFGLDPIKGRLPDVAFQYVSGYRDGKVMVLGENYLMVDGVWYAPVVPTAGNQTETFLQEIFEIAKEKPLGGIEGEVYELWIERVLEVIQQEFPLLRYQPDSGGRASQTPWPTA